MRTGTASAPHTPGFLPVTHARRAFLPDARQVLAPELAVHDTALLFPLSVGKYDVTDNKCPLRTLPDTKPV